MQRQTMFRWLWAAYGFFVTAVFFPPVMPAIIVLCSVLNNRLKEQPDPLLSSAVTILFNRAMLFCAIFALFTLCLTTQAAEISTLVSALLTAVILIPLNGVIETFRIWKKSLQNSANCSGS